MPPRTRKRNATESNGTEDAAPKKTTRAPRNTGASSNKRRKVFSVVARNRIEKQGSDFVKFIDREIKTRIPRVGSDIFKKDLSPDLAAILPYAISSSALRIQNTQTYPKMMLKALDELQNGIKTYEELVKQDGIIKTPNWMRWEQDAKDLEEMSKHTLTVASKIVNHVIMPDLHELPPKPPENASGVDIVAWDLIEEGLPKMPDDIWGKVAQGHLKAFTQVLKALPTEE
ncbi:60s ribosomal l15 [Fusarium beomiforme]|uniref:60s ribosomal l15 n=1 Tax=Fusarium beomiforme TaxID=44412 RepID=A0A9P5ATV8_9HYPO|nr:60s ribosomal l15 [Fusarium beomiforme]